MRFPALQVIIVHSLTPVTEKLRLTAIPWQAVPRASPPQERCFRSQNVPLRTPTRDVLAPSHGQVLPQEVSLRSSEAAVGLVTTMATLNTLTTSREVADHQVGEAAVVKRVIKVIYINDGGGDDDDDHIKDHLCELRL